MDSGKSGQKGIALLAVLVLVLLITGVGIMAFNQGAANTDVSTNAQLKLVLKQSTDTVMRTIDREIVKSSGTNCQPSGYLSDSEAALCLNEDNRTQVVGYLYKQAQETTGSNFEELAYCFRPMQGSNGKEIYTVTKMTAVAFQNGAKPSSTTTVCNINSPNDFMTRRRVAVTQVHFSIDPTPQLCAGGECCELGVSPPVCKTRQLFRVHTISASNLFSAASGDQINDCLRRPVTEQIAAGGDGQTVTECLGARGIPYNAQVQEYLLQPIINN